MNTPRTVKEIIEPQMAMEGAGVLLRRSISPQASNLRDPFLLFDHFAFNTPAEGPITGFPMHPHRGIETVTYMLEGSVHHRDSLGNADLIGPGDMQWMTAGGGILHEEMPRRGESGNIFGFQLWVNLPSTLKWSQPRYRGVSAEDIPTVEKDGAIIRVIAGEVDGIRGPVTEIAADPIYLDLRLAPDTQFSYPVPSGHTVIAYVFEGSGLLGADESPVSATSMVFFSDGDDFQVKTTDSPVRLMLIAGAPFKEPAVPYGPFVMNTQAEIMEAFNDLQRGTFIWNEADPRFKQG
ncbi:MAG: pirin family protein [Anaerolineae bacterium]|jgi:quercetin 2,3-dioxygenase|nr:pirin family protein [Anaerolineae bacterium]MBT7072243.1 pirin family protein [Anaerolineae bacterium]MBT7601043.1 pirin family protein [Anaerolineae bacterium]MBT7990670.1 pirin family protein [Anaerolineae bacterium]